MGEELRRLIRSGFIQDTLFQITGEPSEVGTFYPDTARAGLQGHYDPRRDAALLRPGLNREEQERTLSHEAGHRLLNDLMLKKQRGELTEEEQAMLSALPERFIQLHQMKDRSQQQRYAASAQKEHFAVAFQRALESLRTPEGEGRQDSIQSAEREIPGVQAVADFLLGLPPFSR